MSFPTLSRNPLSITLKVTSPVIKKTSSAKYTMLRKIGTKIGKSWDIVYGDTTLLNQTDIDTLLSFFEEQMGLYFDWLNPKDNVTYSVFFDSTNLEPKEPYFGMEYYELTYTLKEV